MVAMGVTRADIVRVGSVHPHGMGHNPGARAWAAWQWQVALMAEMGEGVARQARWAERPQEWEVEGDQHMMAGCHQVQVEAAMALPGKKVFHNIGEEGTPMEVVAEAHMEIRKLTYYTGVPEAEVEEMMVTTRKAQGVAGQVEAYMYIRQT